MMSNKAICIAVLGAACAFIFFTSASPADAATLRTVVVDPGGTGDYVSLNAALAAEAKDLVSLDRVLRIECISSNGAADTTGLGNISGWTTDATRYLHIVGNNTTGKWNTTKYRLQRDSSGFSVAQNGITKMIVENMQFVGNIFALVQAPNGGTWTSQFDFTFRGNILNGNSHANTTYGFYIQPTTVVNGSIVRLINNVVFNINSADNHYALKYGRAAAGSGTFLFVAYNNTFYSANKSIWKQGVTTEYLKNNILVGVIASFSDSFTDNDIYNDYNSYSVNNNHIILGSHGRYNQTFTFADAANGDFHLSSSDAGAKGYGTNLSGDGIFAFNTDIDGTVRASTWDIGADQITQDIITAIRKILGKGLRR